MPNGSRGFVKSQMPGLLICVIPYFRESLVFLDGRAR